MAKAAATSKKTTKSSARKEAPEQIVEKKEKPTAKPVAEKKPVEKAPKAPAEKISKESSKKSASAPTSMDELLALTNYQVNVPKKGESVKGIITRKDKKMLMVDIGAKTEGIVVDKEYDVAADFINDMKEGDEIEAVVLSAENSRGQVLLSLKQAAVDARWEFFTHALKEDRVLEAKGIEVNKGGLIVLVDGMRGFVPSSQFGKQYMGKIKNLKGETVKVKAIEVDREKNRLIFSERHVSEAQEIAQREEALHNVKVGTTYSGVVSGVMPFGLFVTVEVPVEEGSTSLGHVEGLIHISEISWEKVNDPKDYHSVGDRVDVKVLGVDEQTGKLNLSLKQLTDDPWKGIADKYSVGTTFTGTVSRVETFGVFVKVEPGVDGLIHSSKLDPSQPLTKGDEVTVTVESVEPEQRRMSLSMVTTELPMGYK